MSRVLCYVCFFAAKGSTTNAAPVKRTGHVEEGNRMMRLTRMASLLVAFCLLASAATAHAECAWGRLAIHRLGLASAGTAINFALGNRGNNRFTNGVREEN